jgi:YD repeat-containing protein
MSYDATNGNLLSVVADAGDATHFNAKTGFTYNTVGQVLTTTDPMGAVTRYTYDNRGNRTSITRDAGSGRLNQLTTMDYTALGDLASEPRTQPLSRTHLIWCQRPAWS